MIPPRQLGPHLWRLGNHNFGCYLIRSRGVCALFEVAVSVTAPLILAQLESLEAPPEEMAYLVVSHAHGDHASGQAALAAGLPRARLVMSSACLRHLEKQDTAPGFAEEDHFTRAALVGLDPWLAAQPAAPPLPLLPRPVQEVEPGQSLMVGQVAVSFLEARGHAPGGLVAWLPGEGALLASDSVGFPMSGGQDFPLYFVSRADYVDNLAVMADLEPQVVGLGHQGCYLGLEAGVHLARQVEHIENMHQRVLAAGPQGAPALIQQLFSEYYHQELAIYQPEVIMECCQWLVKRSLEET